MADMEYWGEFLDSEWYVGEHPDLVFEPWRQHQLASRSHLFKREFLLLLAQPERLQVVREDHERLSRIRASLIAGGLQQPLEIVIDNGGHLALRDGHHRLLSSAGLARYACLPAFITPSSGIGVTSRSMIDVADVAFASVCA
jgi:hypothetical protein